MKSKIRNDERTNIFLLPWLIYNAFLIIRKPKINENAIEPVKFMIFLKKTVSIKTHNHCTTDFEFKIKVSNINGDIKISSKKT